MSPGIKKKKIENEADSHNVNVADYEVAKKDLRLVSLERSLKRSHPKASKRTSGKRHTDAFSEGWIVRLV